MKVQGFSPSLWKSLAVKSLRLGWPAGFNRAVEAMGPSGVKWSDLILCQVFEDVWPSRDQLPDVLAEARRRDVAAICRRQTHHGRPGLTADLIALCAEIEATPRNDGVMRGKARTLDLPWMGPRALFAFTYWYEADPPHGGRRSVDDSPWGGVPPAVADMHTSEGRRRGTDMTLLCGHVDGHAWLAREVQAHGWPQVRRTVHAERVLPGEVRQSALFDER